MWSGLSPMSSIDTKRSPAAVPAGLPRLVDLVVASLGLAVLAPALLVIAVAVKLSSAGPVIFRQQRIGRGGQEFSLLKFRSMRAESDGPEVTAAGDTRVTRIGRALRRFKLDELPSLWNIVRGDMALVGPRPEVPRYVDLKNPLWQIVLSVRPGLTDPVTVGLRNEEELLASVDDPDRFYRETLQPYKLVSYVEYLSARSAGSDLTVLMNTLLAILIPGRTPPPTIEEIPGKVGAGSDRASERIPEE